MIKAGADCNNQEQGKFMQIRKFKIELQRIGPPANNSPDECIGIILDLGHSSPTSTNSFTHADLVFQNGDRSRYVNITTVKKIEGANE